MGRRIVIDVDTKDIDADASVTPGNFLDTGMRLITAGICTAAEKQPDPRAFAKEAGILTAGELGDAISRTMDGLPRRNT